MPSILCAMHVKYIRYKLMSKEIDMANKVNMTLRIEPELKKETMVLFESLGLDMSTATGLFYRQALRCHGLPFDVRVDEPNETTYAAMEASENDTDVYGPFDDTSQLMAALYA